MGLFSDYLEQLRENSNFDICLVIPYKTAPFQTAVIPTFNAGRAVKEQLTQNHVWNQAFAEQVKMLLNAENYEQQYISSLYLMNRCVFRQNQLRQLLNTYRFKTIEVIDTINEYIELIEHSMEYAHERLVEAKCHIDATKCAVAYVLDDIAEKSVTLLTLLDSLFYYLSVIANTNDSHFVQAFFEDVSFLIQEILPNQANGKKPKEICKEYFEENFHPTYGIDTCENCGKKLYRECPYCFNCYERN